MAFHVACPITCRRICYCELGFPAELRSERARAEFLEEVEVLEEFLRDPWTVRTDGGSTEATVQVLVPRVVPQPAPPPVGEDGGGGGREEAKRAAMQRQAVAASLAAEDYVRRLEAGGAAEAPGEVASHLAGEDQNFSTMKVMCRLCFSGENEGSKRAIKMLSCKTCCKKYHRSCLKSWAEHRDLFHWSSWACPSCRICEVCRRTGDPNKLMFCKRCDGAYHCYCQQPPHKNVSNGPYLCPKHTRCHSCGSAVPGSGLSTRWFLGYTCCDACGRLFVKGNYCPVCLRVYRDSETTPMVCCDVCERWVHCVCDGISDEKYQQFQADQNLYYKCAACRGDCYQVKDVDDAVQELWRRRDIADRDQISSLRAAAAGLPSEEEIFSPSTDSDDEQAGPIILKDDTGKTLKFSVKGISDKQLKNLKEHGKSISKNSALNKKHVQRKGYPLNSVGKPEETYQNFERQREARSLGSSFRDQQIYDMNSLRTNGPEVISSSMTRSTDDDGMKSCDNQTRTNNHSFTNEEAVRDFDTVPKVKIKGGKLQSLHFKECGGNKVSKSESVRGTKLVIHIGSRNRNVSGSPRSETSRCHRDQDLAASNGSEDTSQQRTKDGENCMLDDHGGTIRSDGGKGAKLDNSSRTRSSKYGFKEKNVIKLGKISDMQGKSNSGIGEDFELSTACRSPLMVGKRSTEVGTVAETPVLRNDVVLQKKQPVDTPANSFSDPKPLLKLKFKNPYFEQRSSWAPQGEEENSVKGQRSKRKRPAERVGVPEDEDHAQLHQENLVDEAMDANWILQKLGKDAIGKRVEVHQSSDNSWQQGVVSDIIQGTSSLSVSLDDGRSKTLILGKQGVRFVSQKQQRTKM